MDAPPVAIIEKRMKIYPLPRADHCDSQGLRILLEAGLPASFIDALTPVLAKQFLLPNGYQGDGKGEGGRWAGWGIEECRALLSDGGVPPSALFEQPLLEGALWQKLDVHQANGRLVVLRGFEFETSAKKGEVAPIELTLRHLKSQELYELRAS